MKDSICCILLLLFSQELCRRNSQVHVLPFPDYVSVCEQIQPQLFSCMICSGVIDLFHQVLMKAHLLVFSLLFYSLLDLAHQQLKVTAFLKFSSSTSSTSSVTLKNSYRYSPRLISSTGGFDYSGHYLSIWLNYDLGHYYLMVLYINLKDLVGRHSLHSGAITGLLLISIWISS